MTLEHGVREDRQAPYVRTESSIGIEGSDLEEVLAELADGPLPTVPEPLRSRVHLGAEEFELTGLRSGTLTVGRARLPGHTVIVASRSWAQPLGPGELVRIDDLTPYFDGWRRRVLSL